MGVCGRVWACVYVCVCFCVCVCACVCVCLTERESLRECRYVCVRVTMSLIMFDYIIYYSNQAIATCVQRSRGIHRLLRCRFRARRIRWKSLCRASWGIEGGKARRLQLRRALP